MAVKLSPLARTQIEDIWLYSEETWGEPKATAYIDGLFNLFESLPARQHMWRSLPHESLRGVFYAAYREHLVFFRRLSGEGLGVIAVLHQRQDIPNRLKEDAEGFR